MMLCSWFTFAQEVYRVYMILKHPFWTGSEVIKLDMLTWQIVETQYTWENQNYCSLQSSILILPLSNYREL